MAEQLFRSLHDLQQLVCFLLVDGHAPRCLGRTVIQHETARLAAPEPMIGAALRQQLLVRAVLDDTAAIKHENPVEVSDSRQAMRDDHHGFAFHRGGERLLDSLLSHRIQARSGLIQNEDRRILEDHARDRDTLPLPAGELYSALADE